MMHSGIHIGFAENLTTSTVTIHIMGHTFEGIYTYIIIAAGIIATILIALILRYWMRRGVKPRLPPHVYNPLEKLLIYGIVIVGIITSLSPLGLDLTGLLVAGGFLGIIVGLAVQTVASNMFSGIILYFERPFKIGDAIQIGEFGGVVEDISIMSLKLRRWDGVLVRISNSEVFSSRIMNFGKAVARRFSFRIGISYGSDIEKARQALKEILEEHPWVLTQPPPEVNVVEYGDSSIVLEVRGWTPSSEWFSTYMEVIREAKSKLDEVGIEIPFPQIDVHIKEPLSLRT